MGGNRKYGLQVRASSAIAHQVYLGAATGGVAVAVGPVGVGVGPNCLADPYWRHRGYFFAARALNENARRPSAVSSGRRFNEITSPSLARAPSTLTLDGQRFDSQEHQYSSTGSAMISLAGRSPHDHVRNLTALPSSSAPCAEISTRKRNVEFATYCSPNPCLPISMLIHLRRAALRMADGEPHVTT